MWGLAFFWRSSSPSPTAANSIVFCFLDLQTYGANLEEAYLIYAQRFAEREAAGLQTRDTRPGRGEVIFSLGPLALSAG